MLLLITLGANSLRKEKYSRAEIKVEYKPLLDMLRLLRPLSIRLLRPLSIRLPLPLSIKLPMYHGKG